MPRSLRHAGRGELDRLRNARDQTNEELRRRAVEIVELQQVEVDARAENDGLFKACQG